MIYNLDRAFLVAENAQRILGLNTNGFTIELPVGETLTVNVVPCWVDLSVQTHPVTGELFVTVFVQDMESVYIHAFVSYEDFRDEVRFMVQPRHVRDLLDRAATYRQNEANSFAGAAFNIQVD